jgi:SOS-response transcriptional repressor LexA
MDMPDQPPDALADLLGTILSRIDQRLVRENLSARAACLRAGLSAGQIKTMRRQHRMKLQHGASVRTLTRLAAALNTTPEWLTSGIGPEERAPSNSPPGTGDGLALPLAGVVAAGVWTEVTSDKVDLQQSPVPPDPRYPPSWQYAYEVRGNSVDLIARPGDFLIVVDRTAAGLSTRPGDLVIVTRTKDGLQEVTARRFQQNGTDCVLAFGSADSRFNGPALPVRSLAANDQGQTENNGLGGIVIGVYRPLMIS